VRLTPSPHKKYIGFETSKIGNWMETTKTTQYEQGFASGNVECTVSVYNFSQFWNICM
jgi:hypothetical protein